MPRMLFLSATALSSAAHSWKMLRNKGDSPSSAKHRVPSHGLSAHSVPPPGPPLLGTPCAHTKFLQVFPSAHSTPKCTFTAQAESGAAGDKGNTAPILCSPIQHTGLEWHQTVPATLVLRLLTRVVWLRAGQCVVGEASPYNGSTSGRQPVSSTLSLGTPSSLLTKCCYEYSLDLLLTIYLPHSEFLTPSGLIRNPEKLAEQKHHHCH